MMTVLMVQFRAGLDALPIPIDAVYTCWRVGAPDREAPNDVFVRIAEQAKRGTAMKLALFFFDTAGGTELCNDSANGFNHV